MDCSKYFLKDSSNESFMKNICIDVGVIFSVYFLRNKYLVISGILDLTWISEFNKIYMYADYGIFL